MRCVIWQGRINEDCPRGYVSRLSEQANHTADQSGDRHLNVASPRTYSDSNVCRSCPQPHACFCGTDSQIVVSLSSWTWNFLELSSFLLIEGESESPSISNGIKRWSTLVVIKSYTHGVVGQGLVEITGGLSLVQPSTSYAPSIGYIVFQNGTAALTGTGTFFQSPSFSVARWTARLAYGHRSMYQGEVCQTSRGTDNCLYWVFWSKMDVCSQRAQIWMGLASK